MATQPETVRIQIDFELDKPGDLRTVIQFAEMILDSSDNFILPEALKRSLVVGMKETFDNM